MNATATTVMLVAVWMWATDQVHWRDVPRVLRVLLIFTFWFEATLRVLDLIEWATR